MIGSIITETARKAAKSIYYRDGDYYGEGTVVMTDWSGNTATDEKGNVLTDQGLLYCGKCRTLKQIRLYSSLLKRVLEPYCICKCAQAKETAEHNRILRQAKVLNAHHTLSRADCLMLRSTFKEDKYPDCPMSKIAHEYVSRWDSFYRAKNLGLYIYGNVGVGKTFYASCIANEIAHVYGGSVKAVSVAKAVNDMYSTDDKSGFISELASVDLLILDDFGAQRRTDYSNEILFLIIDERYKAQKPLILTGNLDYSVIKQKRSRDRVYDRVIDMCIPYRMTGRSKRGVRI